MTDHETHQEGPDCGVALRELYGFLDGELTAPRRAIITSHLDNCMGCLEAFDFEAELRVAIATCCRSETVPERLRIQVLEAIQRSDEGH